MPRLRILYPRRIAPGVDVDTTVKEVSKVTGKAAEVATPVAKSAFSAASSAAAQDPALFLSSAAAFAALIVFSPAIFGLIASCAPAAHRLGSARADRRVLAHRLRRFLLVRMRLYCTPAGVPGICRVGPSRAR